MAPRGILDSIQRIENSGPLRGLLDFIAAGPQRRAALDEKVGDFMTYITPPNLRPAVEMVGQMNPVQGMSDSMAQFGVAIDPSQSPEARRRAAAGSALEAVLAIAPAAVASRGYMTPAQGLMESILGGSPATKQIGDDLGRFWADEAGNIRVWHGSPHDFDKFSMDKIGTGEGAQAYGHGLYFAENPQIARSYRDVLSGDVSSIGEMAVNTTRSPEDAVAAWREVSSHLPQDVRGAVSDKLARRMSAKEILDDLNVDFYGEFDDEVAQILRSNPGHLYEVNIDANPEDFLDWDKPLSEQPQAVQDAFKPRVEALRRLGASIGKDPDGATLEQIAHPTVQLDDVDWDRGLRQQASDFMREVNIPGIRYLDAGSRGAGEGSRNYVVFDDGLLSILGKDGSPVLSTPRNEAEAMARDILDLRAAGRASEVTDDMMAAADPSYMFNNTPLPMDQASRMARAEEMGFDTGTPLYHGTGADFQAFDASRFGQSDHGAKGRGVYTSQDPDLASSYSTLVSENGRQVYPLSYGLRNPYDGEIPMSMYDEGRSVAFTQQLKDAGFDGVMQPNPRRGGEYTEAVAFNPTNIRSRFARFDPAFKHLGNLSAGLAGIGLLDILGLTQQQQQQGGI